MLYVKIPKDLREYQQKVWFGRTSNELVWIVLALLVGGLTFVICMLTIGTQIGSYITMGVSIPIFFCGFYQIQDMTVLEYLKKIFKYYKNNQYLVYDNDYLVTQKKQKTSKEYQKFKKTLKNLSENN